MPEKELDYEYPNMLKFVLAREGGYVNRKTDRGGPTNKGITQVTYNSYRRSKDLHTNIFYMCRVGLNCLTQFTC